ncbi:efflux RND transporter periplasmic adaptor subunit [Paenibacillus paeoniae]|uniref:Efflux RND transporter periplasmic adaptor subunit n=1 Tax=Paenibacillus paeoniae TaxID=2292705 RepID=A0A371PJE9_9BACL|nr:efflux RND transporter periplasmic adaptor subunit [Paenibacillus paeoniae]REK75779.1 efflux RND transporter periplasmic adaptor subunit [Paenibacillus paeoniae]
MKKQRIASIALIIFLLVLAGLALFSQTLQTALLPKVTTDNAAKKTLTHRIEGSGLITPRRQIELTSGSGWKVANVHVRDDEQVKKGQVLVTFDGAEAEQQLLDAEDEMKKRHLNRELLQEQFVAAQREGDEEVIRRAKHGLELDQLDQDIAIRRIEALRKDITQKRTLTAPADGTVTKLQAEEGLSVSPGQPVLTLVETAEGFQFTFTVDKNSADLIQKDEKVSLKVDGDEPRQIEGTVAEIKDTSSGKAGGSASNPDMDSGNPDGEAKTQKTIVINVSGDGLQGGESASIYLDKPFKDQGLVINKKWIRKDGTGSYVFVVRENRSSIGNTYTVQKAYVKTGHGNDEDIVVLGGVYLDEDIVTESSEPLQEGNRVRLN